MNEELDLNVEWRGVEPKTSDKADGLAQDDDRYPGSFFRIPKPPVAGQTSWSLR